MLSDSMLSDSMLSVPLTDAQRLDIENISKTCGWKKFRYLDPLSGPTISLSYLATRGISLAQIAYYSENKDTILAMTLSNDVHLRETVAKNPAFYKHNMEATLVHDDVEAVRCSLAAYIQEENQFLYDLAGDCSVVVAIAAINNVNSTSKLITHALFTQLSRQIDEVAKKQLLYWVLKNEKTQADVIEYLYNQGIAGTDSWIATAKNTPYYIIQALGLQYNPFTLIDIVARPDINSDLLRGLYKYKPYGGSYRDRLYAAFAKNNNTPTDVLESIYSSPSGVALLATIAQHPNCPDEIKFLAMMMEYPMYYHNDLISERVYYEILSISTSYNSFRDWYLASPRCYGELFQNTDFIASICCRSVNQNLLYMMMEEQRVHSYYRPIILNAISTNPYLTPFMIGELFADCFYNYGNLEEYYHIYANLATNPYTTSYTLLEMTKVPYYSIQSIIMNHKNINTQIVNSIVVKACSSFYRTSKESPTPAFHNPQGIKFFANQC